MGTALSLAMACCASLAQAPGNVYDYSRSDAYTYDPATGFVLTHTVEPSVGALCRVETFGYDANGNRTSQSTANCANSMSLTVPANALFASRTSGAQFTAPAGQNITVAGSTVAVTYPTGLLATTITNAASQSESIQYDPRFGSALSLTGPNALSTAWTLDDFGRVVRETAPDGTSIVSFYCVLASSGLDTSSNSTGCATPSAGEAPADAVSFVQMEPHDASDAKMGAFERNYIDRLGRVIRTVTQGFDGAGQPSSLSGGAVVQDVVYSPYGAVALTSQPYFLSTLSSTTTGSSNVGASSISYDVLGRPTLVLTTDPHGSAGSQSFGVFGSQQAAQASYVYSGLKTTTTNDKGQTRVEERNPIGETVRITDATGAQLVHQADAFGNLVATKDALQNTISIAFDIRGDRLSVNDPDAGVTLDCYDALGELVAYQYSNMRGTAAPGPCPAAPNNGSTTAANVSGWITQAFDVLGRPTQRIEPEFTSTWTYDKYADSTACSKGVGKLCQASTSAGLNRKIVYDSLGRPSNVVVATGTGPTFANAVAYDALTGRVSSVTYPTGLQVGYSYTPLGYPEKLLLNTAATLTPLPPPLGGASSGGTVSLAAGSLLWQAQTVNAWGVMEKQSYGNGIVTMAAFEAATGRTTDLTAGAGGATGVLNHHYVWDSLDNLQSRNDANGDGSGAVTETFNYADGLNRLTGYTVAGPSIPNMSRTVQLQYNALGMLLYKTDVGNYAYGAQGAGSVRPHAPLSVAGSTTTTTLGYDANGNVTSASAGKYRSLTYTSFNLPDSQTGLAGPGGAPQYTWGYDDTHARIKEVKVSGGATRTTWYMHPDNAGGLSFESEINSATNAALNDNRHFLSAAGETVGVLMSAGNVPAPNGTAPPTIGSIALEKVEYWHHDHLGSLSATTDHLGNVTARYAYDPFGKRRYSGGSYDANGQLVVDWSATTNAGTARGFTGHEELDDVGLVHMNGRLFDPTLAVFLQADPLVVHPHNLQSFNRYGYCLSNPLTCADSTGFYDEEDCAGGGGACGGKFINEPGFNTIPSVPPYAQNVPCALDGCLQRSFGSPDGGTVIICAYGCPDPTPSDKDGPPGGGPGKGPGGEAGGGGPGGAGGPGGPGGIGLGPPGGGDGLGGIGSGSGSGGPGGGGGSGGGASTGGNGSANSPGNTGSGAGTGAGVGSPGAGGAGAGAPGISGGGKYSPPGITPASNGHGAAGSVSTWIHAGLTAASFCPSICGSAFSAVDGFISIAEGDYTGGAIALGAAAVGLISDAGVAKAAALATREGIGIAREASAGRRAAEVAAGCGCFVAGTPIAVDGGEIPIERIGIGTMVVSRDEATGQLALKPVTNVFRYEGREIYSLVLLDDKGQVTRIEVTDDHPFMVLGRGWVKSIDLRAGMRLGSLGNHGWTVVHRQDLGYSRVTYNLEVADNHTFFAGEAHVLVHNSLCGLAAKGLSRGVENVASFKGLNEARASARQLSGLGGDAVDFVQEIGPLKGQVTGRMSPDGLRGWRLDFDPNKGFHVNWWDRSAGAKRADWLYGANKIEGGTLDQFWQTLQHFPKN